ncbi:hypothetical protein FB451DRAFT_1175199 [Mycena latifolia]|nr:hypothetical protein FB451DRAFT_1175199 [Mycena latifolia]
MSSHRRVQSILETRRRWKTSERGEAVWPVNLEAALLEDAKDVKDEFWPKTSSLSKRIESARPPPRCGPIPVRPRVMQWMPSTRNLVPWSRRRALHEHPPTLEISSPKSREGWRTHQHNARQRLKWVEANVRGTELEEAATGREAALRGLERVAT